MSERAKDILLLCVLAFIPLGLALAYFMEANDGDEGPTVTTVPASAEELQRRELRADCEAEYREADLQTLADYGTKENFMEVCMGDLVRP